MKQCPTCLEIKPKTEFFRLKSRKSGICSRCKICSSIFRKRSYKANKAQELEANKLWCQNNLERLKETRRKRFETNRERINKRHIDYVTKRRKSDPLFKLIRNLRGGLYKAINSGKWHKDASYSEILGCSQQVLFGHIEGQFQPNMTWDNYGFGPDKWNIDHRLPLSAAKSLKDTYKLSHFSNLQPMWQPKNFKKKNQFDPSELERFLHSQQFVNEGQNT